PIMDSHLGILPVAATPPLRTATTSPAGVPVSRPRSNAAAAGDRHTFSEQTVSTATAVSLPPQIVRRRGGSRNAGLRRETCSLFSYPFAAPHRSGVANVPTDASVGSRSSPAPPARVQRSPECPHTPLLQ